MLQLKNDTRFIDKKFILGIKLQLLKEAYLFKFLTFFGRLWGSTMYANYYFYVSMIISWTQQMTL